MEKRIWGLDLVKTIALILVVSIHGITLSDMVAQTNGTLFWFPTLMLRTAALSCVPLFIIITGYLHKEKEFNKYYFSSLVPVLFSYFIIAALCEVMKIAAGETTNILKGILHVFDFTANGYAWYVEMYIGLFVLIPFINLFYKSLGTERNRLIAGGAIIAVTMLPSAFSSIGLSTFRLAILPDYWDAMYPIAYYFIGMMLADMNIHIKKNVNAVCLVGWILLMSAACFTLSYFSGQYAWWFANGFGCLFNAVTAVLLFLLFYDVKCKFSRISGAVSAVSAITLEAYLFSYITDKLLYKFLALPMPVMTLFSIALSVMLALGFSKLTSQIISGLKEKYMSLADRIIKEP